MAEQQHQSHHVHRAPRAERRMPAALFVVAFLFVLGIGYVSGTFSHQIYSTIAPLFGVKTSSETLDLSRLQSTYQSLKANFAGEIDDDKLIEGASKGMVSALGDEYTVYFNEAESTAFDNDISGTIGGGIGVELSVRNGRITIVRVLADNPAAGVGLAVGDVISKINDVEVPETESINDVVMKIRGDVGTTVKLTVARGPEQKDFTITRADVTNPSVYSSVSNGVGVMTITRFDSQTGQLARAAARTFKDQNVASVILDLRGNGGGYLTAAQDVAGIWLNNKTVVSERNNDTVIDELTSGTNPVLEGVPTVVLVNGSSASASEIVAGALQDHGAATLIGETTFGKGSVQQVIRLPWGSSLKVTIARWYTPNGKNISKQGIAVDQEVKMTIEDVNAARDPQLDAAKAFLVK
jgi:carboxyl-terminal processing protease